MEQAQKIMNENLKQQQIIKDEGIRLDAVKISLEMQKIFHSMKKKTNLIEDADLIFKYIKGKI